MPADRPHSERFADGLKIRREVLGDAYVDRSLAAANDFTWAAQELATEKAWGELWSRPGLGRRERSILTLGVLAAMNRPQEFKAHVRGAINNGVSVPELQEILLHLGGYAGFPVGLDAFRLAGEVLAEMGLVHERAAT
jgi:4-carboxymuconolactone decarboxylase